MPCTAARGRPWRRSAGNGGPGAAERFGRLACAAQEGEQTRIVACYSSLGKPAPMSVRPCRCLRRWCELLCTQRSGVQACLSIPNLCGGSAQACKVPRCPQYHYAINAWVRLRTRTVASSFRVHW